MVAGHLEVCAERVGCVSSVCLIYFVYSRKDECGRSRLCYLQGCGSG